ncbi:unnamed protein product [Parajaminaea phylloscopi]
MAPNKSKKDRRASSTGKPSGANPSAKALNVASFTVLPLSLPGSSLRPTPTHYLYLRRHQTGSAAGSASDKGKSLPPKRTLFVVNLPVDASDRHLRLLFQSAGRIERVEMTAVSTSADDIGVHEDEDEDEPDDDDDSDSDDALDLDGSDAEELEGLRKAAAAAKKVSKKEAARRKAEEAKKPRPPTLVPLPSLDPRRASSTQGSGDYPLLPTGTTAHVVFLEEDSVDRALGMAAVTSSSSGTSNGIGAVSASSWTDPWEEVLRRQAKARQQEKRAAAGGAADDDEDDEDDEAGSGRRKGRPSTAVEAAASHLKSQDPRPPLGLTYLLGLYDAHRPPLDQVKAHADSVVARYTFFRSHPRYASTSGIADADAEEARLASGLGSSAGIKVASYGPNGEALDEDGFTIVVPGGKYGRALGPSSGSDGAASIKVARRLAPTDGDGTGDESRLSAKKRKKAENTEGLEDFYRFQMRERRKERLAEMRKQFDEDREKVAKLKEDQAQNGKAAKRRFRPY